jgi:hypothetical protein
VDGEIGESETLIRSAQLFETASRDLAALVSSLHELADAAALRALALGDRSEIPSFAVRSVIAARSLRTEFFDASVGEAGWGILLEVFAARLEGLRISMSALGAASGLPKTTAYNRICCLIDRGLLVRVPDPKDERIALIELSDEAADRMRAYLMAALRLLPWVS